MNIISESEYLANERSLRLAEKFFDIEDVSLLKVGTFGYITSLFSQVMRDSVFHRDMLFNEVFLTNATLNSTVHNWAKLVDEDISLAEPARMDVAFTITLNDLEKASRPALMGEGREFKLDRKSVVDIGGFKFLLPYSVNILLIRDSNGQSSVSASYDLTEYNVQDSDISSPFIKTMISTNSDGTNIVTMALAVLQMELRTWVNTITSTDILDVGSIEENYGGNLVGFRVDYSNNSNAGIPSWAPVEAIFNEIEQPKTGIYTYYTVVGDDVLRLSFSNKPGGFRPAFNSKVRLETFTTLAERANFEYSGGISILDPNLENIEYSCVSLSGRATGGTSNRTFVDTKIALMEKLRTRDGITTSYDLQTYFNEIKRKRLKTNSSFTVVKLRDDIIRRQFSLFMLQRDSKNDVVPTNTVNMEFSIEELSAMSNSIRPGDVVVYDRIESRYRMLRDNELIESYLNSPEAYVYCVPFLINFDFIEFPKANIYMTNFSKTVNLTYLFYKTDTPYRVVINDLSISRNPVTDQNRFNISCFMNTANADLNDFKLRLVLRTNNLDVAYIDLDRVGNTNEFKVEIETEDRFDNSGNYIIENVFKSADTQEILETFRLSDKFEVNIGVLAKNEVSEDQRSVYGAEGYGLITELVADETISFAEDLTDIMYSQLSVNRNTGRIVLKSIPLIGAQFFLNIRENEEIMKEIFSTLRIAKDSSRNLENNTSIDMKFYNSYGVSQYYNCDTIDISIVLNIYTKSGSINQGEVRRFVTDVIEASNERIDKRFSVSNLIKELETKFNDINYIEFVSLNGLNLQTVNKIEYLDELDSSLPVSYVPEFLTVRKKLPISPSSDLFDYDITVRIK